MGARVPRTSCVGPESFLWHRLGAPSQRGMGTIKGSFLSYCGFNAADVCDTFDGWGISSATESVALL